MIEESFKSKCSPSLLERLCRLECTMKPPHHINKSRGRRWPFHQQIHHNVVPSKLKYSSFHNRNEMKYVDKWFESIVKPVEFYGKHSSGDVRRYFYNVDLQGRLFLGTFPCDGRDRDIGTYSFHNPSNFSIRRDYSQKHRDFNKG